MTWIPRRPLEHRDIETSLAQPPPKLRAIIERDAQQDALARQNRNLTPIHRIVVRRNRLGIPQHQFKFRRPRQRFAISLRSLLRITKKKPGLRLRLLPRSVIKLNPPVPPLRADLANPLQKPLNFPLLLPEAGEAVPFVDVHSGKKIGNVDNGGGAALG